VFARPGAAHSHYMALVSRCCTRVCGFRRKRVGFTDRDEGEAVLSRLNVMSLNMQYYSSYPEDRAAAREKLQEVTGADGDDAVDVIAVQEGIRSVDVLSELGYEKVVCAGELGVAQTVREMVYSDETALNTCPPELRDELLCNQIYLRTGSDWLVEGRGAERVSSMTNLHGGEGRSQGPLAMRSMAWVKLRRTGRQGRAVFVMCTHLTGGRFEDQYYMQQLAKERREQPIKCASFFSHRRPNPQKDDIGMLIGDFNALPEYAADGPMHAYFKAGIANSKGVELDAKQKGVNTVQDLEEHFKNYMTSPFKALKDLDWTFAYGPEVGATSRFGHLIDHIALSTPVEVLKAEVQHLTNQLFSSAKPDTDLVLTDHNAIRVTFAV